MHNNRMPGHAKAHVIATDDGVMFSCVAKDAPEGEPGAPYWSLVDSRGLEWIGPARSGTETTTDLQRLVTAWWKEKNADARRDDASPSRLWLRTSAARTSDRATCDRGESTSSPTRPTRRSR